MNLQICVLDLWVHFFATPRLYLVNTSPNYAYACATSAIFPGVRFDITANHFSSIVLFSPTFSYLAI